MENSLKCENCGDIINRPVHTRGPLPRFCSKITCNAQHRGHIISKLTVMRYSWSSHGGINASSTEKVKYDWYCQACGEQFPEEMSPMKFPLDIFGKEYANVCGNCYATGINRHLMVFTHLSNFIRRRIHGIW